MDFNGHVFSFGGNYDGQVGDGTKMDVIRPKRIRFEKDKEIIIEEIACGDSHSYCKSVDGDYYLFGKDSKSQCLVSLGEIRDYERQQIEPKCINAVIRQKYKNAEIVSISLGYDTAVFVLACDSKKK